MKMFKLNLKDDPGVGSVVRFKDHAGGKKIAGEIAAMIGTGDSVKYELIVYDMRLKPIIRGDGSFKRKTVPSNKCKLIDATFKFDTRDDYQVGDVICKHAGVSKKFGIIVGFTHPDGLFTTSYESGYNGIDFIDCVEISKRGLRRKKDMFGKIKRFTTTKKQTKMCEIDLWNRSGPKIKIK